MSDEHIFTPQTWVMIVVGVAAAAFFGGSLTTGGDKYVPRTEYLAGMATVHESVADLKTTIAAMDLYMRQNLPERKPNR